MTGYEGIVDAVRELVKRKRSMVKVCREYMEYATEKYGESFEDWPDTSRKAYKVLAEERDKYVAVWQAVRVELKGEKQEDV